MPFVFCTTVSQHDYSSLGCVDPDYKGDGGCDDQNNNAGCEYDGGDCCGNDVVTTFCTECQCLDPDNGGTGMKT